MKKNKLILMLADIYLIFCIVVAILVAIVSIAKPDLLFDEVMDLYGPLKNNLVFVLLYVGVVELALFFLQFYKKITFESLIIGCVHVLIAFGSQFYAEINQLPLSSAISIVFGFIASGHVFYYLAQQPEKAKKGNLYGKHK